MKKNCCIKYTRGTAAYEVSFSGCFENEHLLADLADSPDRTTLLLTPKEELTLRSLSYTYEYDFTGCLTYLNGYQSWTDSTELCGRDSMPGLSARPGFLVKALALDGYGDYGFTRYTGRKGFFHGFTYGYIRKDDQYCLIGSLSERNGFTVLYFDTAQGRITVEKDCAGLLLKDTYRAFDTVTLRGSKDDVFDRYFEQMHIVPPSAKPITGYTSWYNHYQNISEEIILQNLNAVRNGDFRYDVFQIDDGFAQYVGDWLKFDKRKFPGGLEHIAGEIRRSGMEAGIWLAPFICERKSDLFRQHPDWIVRREDGTPFLCGNNWSGFAALDFYNPEVQSYIREVIAYYQRIGFHFFKLDFLYAVCVLPRKDKTRGQICCEATEFIRECVGSDLILGCGVPLAPCFGIFDYMRIGCDVSLDWNSTPVMRMLHRERPGTKPALLNTVYRSHLNGRAFLNDPDVFLLRDSNLRLTAVQKEILLKINCLFGSLLFTSDNVQEYTDEKKALLRECLCLNRAEQISAVKEGDVLSVSYTLQNTVHKLKIDLKRGKYLPGC